MPIILMLTQVRGKQWMVSASPDPGLHWNSENLLVSEPLDGLG